MRYVHRRVIVPGALGVMLGAAAACSAPPTSDAAPAALPFEDVTTTTLDTSSTIAALPDEVPQDTPGPALTVEMFDSMLATENGRAMLVASIAAEGNLESEAAECLLDEMPREMLVEAAGSWLGGGGDAGLFSAEQVAEIVPVLERCGIDPGSLASTPPGG